MLSQLLTIGFLMLFSSMLPGPDFAMVTHNTLFHSKKAGLFTSLGVGTAILVHISYCVLGLALIISQSVFIFSTIKYIGAIYLIYLGVTAFFSKSKINIHAADHQKTTSLNSFKAFKQGFLCNLLNPKATIFFLALFTTIIKPDTSGFLGSHFCS